MHYVIGDVHGCFDEMTALLDKIENKDPDARIIFIGDFLDRGPKVWETLQWMQEHITPEGKYQCLMGNHEYLIIEWFKEFKRWWREEYRVEKNIDPCPATQYDFALTMAARGELDLDHLLPVIGFLKTLPGWLTVTVPTGKMSGLLTYQIGHAWYTADPNLDLDSRTFFCVWDRENEYKGYKGDDCIIVHGHTPTLSDYRSESAPAGMIGYRKNSINVDSGCVYSRQFPEFPCMLSAICLETLEEIYPCSLEERFAQLHPRWTDEQIRAIAAQYQELNLQTENVYRAAMLKRLAGEEI